MSGNEYIIGQPIELLDEITNPRLADAPTDDSTAAVTVYQPDGTPIVASGVHGVTGAYSASFTPTQLGPHRYIWRATTTAAGAGWKWFYVGPVP